MGSPLGSIIGFYLVHIVNSNMINIHTTLLLPAVIIILTGIIQKITFNIPLLENKCEEVKLRE